MRRIIGGLVLLGCLAAWVTAGPALARQVSLIRDAEIEHIIRTYSAPLFEAAGLDPRAVSVHLVNDPQLNAFVAGGQRIFIHTGLLTAADTPNQVIGVLAHETGHIMGGHLARTQEALRHASAASIVAMLLGTAAIVAGAGEAAGGILAGGATVAERNFLQYSRTQESSADQAALTLLDRTGQSPRGLLQFMEKLGDQEALLTANQDPYARTHPLSSERVETIRAHIQRNPTPQREDPELQRMHERMQAKLRGFLDDPNLTLRRIPADARGIPERYARAVALFRARELDQAIAVMDGLLAEHPQDPWFYELKGQILFDSGRIRESVAPYREAVSLRPSEPLLHSLLGQAQVATEDPALLDEAIEHLRLALREQPENRNAWHWISIAYGRQGNTGMAALATAERYLLIGEFQDALHQAERASRELPEGSPGSLRAQDLKAQAERQQKQAEERGR